MQTQKDKLGKVSITVEKDYWNINKDYDKLTVVEKEGIFGTFLSRKPVPAGTPLTNRTYWIPFSSLKEEIIIAYQEWVNKYGGIIESETAILNGIQQVMNDVYKHLPQGIYVEGNIDCIEQGSEDDLILNFGTTNNKNGDFSVYINDILYGTYKNIKDKELNLNIHEDTVVRIECTQNGYTFIGSWNVACLYPSYIGYGLTYEDVLENDDLKIDTKIDITGFYSVIANVEDGFIFICVPKDKLVSNILMNSYNIPMEEPVIVRNSENIEYKIYKSINSYELKDYIIYIGDYVDDTKTKLDEVLTRLDQIDGLEGNGEDINTNNRNELQFADRIYNEDNPNGMGYVILRKDKTFVEQIVDKPNTIFEIRYDFDLGGISIEIPLDCVLKFIGGSLKNGTIVGNNTLIVSRNNNIFYKDILLFGTFANNEFFSDWVFGGTDTQNLQAFLSFYKAIGYIKKDFIITKNYNVLSTIEIGEANTKNSTYQYIRIIGRGENNYPVKITSDNPITILRIYSKAVDLFNIDINFTTDYRNEQNAICILYQKGTDLDVADSDDVREYPNMDSKLLGVSTNNGYIGIGLTGNNFHVLNCITGNCKRGIMLFQYTNIVSVGGELYTTRYNRILNCESHGGNRNSIFININGDSYIGELQVQGCFNNSQGTFISGNVDGLNFIGNSCFKTDGFNGMVVGSYKNTVFSNNIFSPQNNKYLLPFIFKDVDNVLIQGNLIKYCGGAFVQSENGRDLMICNNIINSFDKQSYPVSTSRQENTGEIHNYRTPIASYYACILIGIAANKDNVKNITISNNSINSIPNVTLSEPFIVNTNNPTTVYYNNNKYNTIELSTQFGVVNSPKRGNPGNLNTVKTYFTSNSNGALYWWERFGKPLFFKDGEFITADGVKPNVSCYGTTSQRPAFADIYNGFKYYDTTFNMEIINDNNTWVDANGRTPGKHSGELSDLPNFISGTAGANDDGYMFTFTNDATYGNKIVWWNTNAGGWVDATSTVVIPIP